jgi:hypothetical protein
MSGPWTLALKEHALVGHEVEEIHYHSYSVDVATSSLASGVSLKAHVSAAHI